MSYTHLSARERMSLFYMHQYGYSLREIGRRLHRSPSTLSRELKRNARRSGGYCDWHAQKRADERKRLARHQRAYQHLPLRSYVFAKLKSGWSPELIAGRLRKDFPRSPKMRASHETLYQWVYRDAKSGGDVYKDLVRAHKKRQKRYQYGRCRGAIINRVDISQRPHSANNRSRYGHWEGDTVVGHRHQGRLATHVERKSRYLIAGLMKNGTAEAFNQATCSSYQKIPPQYRQTLTLDNGSENAQHQQLSHTLQLKIYFAKPYASWERGTNENTNGLIRRFFPKTTNFLEITQKQLDRVVDLLNHRPRKCLDYRTPFEVFNKITNGALAT